MSRRQASTWIVATKNRLLCGNLMPDKKSAVLRQKIGYCAAAFSFLYNNRNLEYGSRQIMTSQIGPGDASDWAGCNHAAARRIARLNAKSWIVLGTQYPHIGFFFSRRNLAVAVLKIDNWDFKIHDGDAIFPFV